MPKLDLANDTRTQDRTDGANQTAPSISLPKGGGAIRGIGEKFAANLATGTGSIAVPIVTSPGRSGFGPQLSLSYDSGSGNGPFGLGWSLDLPQIARKTDKGLPKYQDAAESDVFILSGAEDLVPSLVEDGDDWIREIVPERVVDQTTYRIERYRPRIEGLFARIERWTNTADSTASFWRSISRENVTTFYGKSAESRITDPKEPSHIFAWLICESHDDKGNIIEYSYKAEDSKGVDVAKAHERNRSDETRSANRYIKRIRYGNHEPYFPELASDHPWPMLPAPEQWLFEVVFDYGEHDSEAPTPLESRDWLIRSDPYSSYRSSFELRCYRLCQRVLMFHHIPDAPDGTQGYRGLVRSTNFAYSTHEDPGYARNPIFSFLLAITQIAFRRESDGTYSSKSIPPVEFDYSRFAIDDTIHEVDHQSLENLPAGLAGAGDSWLDLDGEGFVGILTRDAEGWFYKRNLSAANPLRPNESNVEARFSAAELLASKPALGPGSASAQFFDLAGDGQLELVTLGGPSPGFYERNPEEGWESFTAFKHLPVLEWDDPNLRFVDLTGDGIADILITEDEVLCWHLSLGEAGFGPREATPQARDEEKGPRLVFAESTQTIHLADMSGDGLTDLVRIRNGEVCYWPNLGYGCFGAKIAMDQSPCFDSPDMFDPQRIRLADLDGSGVTDILYLGGDGARIYFNQSGNSWSPACAIPAFPRVDDHTSVAAVDLLGSGTACLVWSSPLPGHASRPMRYLDFAGGKKPHLLVSVDNNLGAETHVQYAPSTKFYLQDKLAGKPWISALPFPVQVVERVETIDRISRNRFVTRNVYHHGYFDGEEREFRGFGMIEQWDTEEFGVINANQLPTPATNIAEASHVPPVLTRTWFHTGIALGRNRVSNFFAGLIDPQDLGEYYREPGLTDDQAKKLLLDDTILPPGLTADEEREACRVLKGAMLRQEVYALDGTDKEVHPYSVTEQSITIKLLQPRGDNRHAVFFAHPRESIDYHYERIPNDPRVAHSLALELDDFGNILKSAAVAYGRRQSDPAIETRDQEKQSQFHVLYEENRFTGAVLHFDSYRTPLSCEVRRYELTGLSIAPTSGRFTFDELLSAGTTPASIAYHETPVAGVPQRRLVEHARILYRRNDLEGALPLGQLESQAIPFESYKLSLTKGLVEKVYGTRVSEPMLINDGRYVHSEADDQWWVPSGQVFFSSDANDVASEERAHARLHFFRPRRYQDPFGNTSSVNFDPYDLLIRETRDALANIVTVGERSPSGNLISSGNDYRVLQPRLVTNPNGNRAAVAFDVLGLVVGTAVMGKRDENPRKGDLLDGFMADLPEDVVADHLANPLADPHGALQRATTRLMYDLGAYGRSKHLPQPAPSTVYTIVRETHDAELTPGQQTKVQHSFSYSDGFGREIQKKFQAETGPVPLRNASGEIMTGPDGQPEMTLQAISPRWVGSGWTIFNNKGNVVRRFEPFFSDLHHFEFDARIGVSPFYFYDPLGRMLAILYADRTWEKVVFSPWRQENWDVNDTALIEDPRSDKDTGDSFRRLAESHYLPSWCAERRTGALGPAEQAAAAKTEIHAGTPSVSHIDSLGRIFLTIAHNRFHRSDAPSDPPQEEFYASRVEFDIESNPLSVIDAKDRLIVHYAYDLLGNRIQESSMDAGERRTLTNVFRNVMATWDSKNHQFRATYDPLQRRIETFLREGSTAEKLIVRTVYGESNANPELTNQRGNVVRLFDQSGLLKTEEYDFNGNLLTNERQLAAEYREILDWSATPLLESKIYASESQFDALNRPVHVITPDGSIYRPTFNEGNFLETVDVNLRGAQAATPFVTNIEYNSRGQRTLIEYGNGAQTSYVYDRSTFRLSSLLTRSFNTQLQALHYTYDPNGNITHIQDAAQQTIYFSNQVVTPDCDYGYDAVYRLIHAEGREHVGQAAQPQTTWNDEFRSHHPHPNDGQAMRRYVQEYEYDEAGNILQLSHKASLGNWNRKYNYNEASLTEGTKTNNRLSSTIVGGNNPIVESYASDTHGNMTAMPHLTLIQWDFKDQLRSLSRQAINNGTPETTFYVYDAAGRRVRKITERQNGTRKSERAYLEGLEIFREYDGSGTSVTLERETLYVMDDKQHLALVETRTQGNDGSPQRLIRYQLGDHLASTSLELDDTGQIISYEEFYPFGSTSYQAGRTLAEVRLKRYRYTGQERDDESGFYYKQARYYPPWLGRWINADPTGLTGGQNLYCYAFNSPILFKDVTGDIPDRCFVNFDNGDRLYSPTRCGPLSKWKKKRPGKKGGKKGSTTGTEGGVEGGEEGGVPGGVVGGTGSTVGAEKKDKPGEGDGPGTTPGTGDQSDPNPPPKSDEPASTGPGDSTKTTPAEGKTETEKGDQGGTETDMVPGGKPGGSKQGTAEGTQTTETPTEGTESSEKGKGGGESSVLADLSALASLISDPDSLYEAQQSGNKGSGSASGSSFGFIGGWFAQILTIALVFGGAIKKFFSAIGGAIKNGFNSLKNKLFGSVEKKLLTEEAESLAKNAAKKFSDAEEEIIQSYMRSGKTRDQAEKAVLEFRGETVEVLSPNTSPNASGTTRKPNNPGPGKKRP